MRRGPGTPPLQLSRREWEVAILLGEGYSNREIANMLSVSVSTVKIHVHHVLCKLGVQRRAHVYARLTTAGLAAEAGQPKVARP